MSLWSRLIIRNTENPKTIRYKFACPWRKTVKCVWVGQRFTCERVYYHAFCQRWNSKNYYKKCVYKGLLNFFFNWTIWNIGLGDRISNWKEKKNLGELGQRTVSVNFRQTFMMKSRVRMSTAFYPPAGLALFAILCRRKQ
jgi:hypothetical protein